MLTGRPRGLDRPQRAPRPASATSSSSTRRSSTRRPAPAARPTTLAHRWALPFLRAGRQTIVFGRSRTAVEILLSTLRESLREELGPRSRVRGYRGGYLPTERRAIERGLRDGEILGVVATNALELGRRHRPARRVDPRRLPGLGRGDVAADRPGRPARRHERRDPRRLGARRSTSTSIHHPEFLLDGTPEEARARPGQPPRPARPPPRGDVRAAVRAGRGVRAGPGGRPARVPRRVGPRPPGRATAAGTGARRTSRRRRSRCGRAAPENVVIIDTTPGPAAGPRRGRPVQRPGPRPRARDLHPRVGPVPRRPARVGRAQGLRPQDRRRPLHVRQPGGDAEAARRLRRGAGDGRAGGSTAR